MLRRMLLASLLLGLYLNAIAVRFTPQVVYWMNQQLIASKFCENKARPQLHCNGKCHLAKQLRQAEATEQRQGPCPAAIAKSIAGMELIPPTLRLQPAPCGISAAPVVQVPGLPTHEPALPWHPPKA